MSLAYLTAWQGPVLEKDDPYDGELTKNLAPVKHVQEAQIIESKDLEKIKEAVLNMVQSRLLFTVHCRMSIAVPNILIRRPILIAMLVQKAES